MNNRKRVAELLNETSCEHNKTKKSACNKATPGATTGGCAFEGAQIALFPFADVAHLVHGPITCLGASWETRATPSSYQESHFTDMGFTTDVSLNDVIFGGEKKLKSAIEYIYDNYAPKGIFIYSTCVTAMIGDDLEAVCREYTAKYAIPVISINAPGFSGSKNLGSRLGVDDVLEKIIGTKEPESTNGYDINLIGEYNVTGDMWQYSELLKEIGINVLSTISGDGRIEKVASAHRAKLNVLVCAKSLISIARKMEEKYAIPYVSVSFYGKRDTTNAIMAIANALGDAKIIAKAKEVCEREESKLEAQLAVYKAHFKGKKALLNTGGNKAWSIASALQDMGIEVVGTSVRKCTEDDIAKCKEVLGETGILMQSPANEQAKIISEKNVDILLAGGRSLYTAIKKRVAFVDVNQEKKISYGAYAGLLNFAKDVCDSLDNKVFANVGKPAPWEAVQ